ncbi:4-hydroxy-3-methylbut-2-en-1-yl diphosphate synthase (flavodoxin) [Clostridia bacterium]|nr:4-hydroxy-3-methylbut-2-en-1-yl diphosphate synthase (flavodoxin) [Clostridia bacterium]
MRKKTREISIGSKKIGGKYPILIQSMTNTKTEDIQATVKQILSLERVGCEIIRVAVPNEEAAKAIPSIKKQIHIPLVADIHFDHRLAILAMEAGVDKIRINPGNIGDKKKVNEVVQKAKEFHIPIRVGVNGGSLEKDLLKKYGGVHPEALVESVEKEIAVLEEQGFQNIVISIKASEVLLCVRAYEMMAEKTDYPFHIGITETGTLARGNIKSAVGLGVLLYQGIGDTLRVSLTGDPLEEIKTAKWILQTLDLKPKEAEVISCPTCGRTNIDLISLANQVEELVSQMDLKPIKIAVMGCAVNGPGEAREADIGIAGGKGEGILFKEGQIVKKIPEEQLFEVLAQELEAYIYRR